MTASEPSEVRVVCFGDLEGGVWGALVDLGQPAIVFATQDGVGSPAGDAAVAVTEDQGRWRLTGDGFDLSVMAASGHPESTGQAELCQVSGTLSAGGQDTIVDCVGIRSVASELRPKHLESLRGLSGWFDGDHGLTLIALRPAGAKGQESDVVDATLFEPEGWTTVEDPRMSTTYGPGERPSRASLELWIGEGDEQFPRRAAAEASAKGAAVQRDGLTLLVTPMRCHARGLDGAGVYLLAHLQ
jgi:hypothetical protein